MLGPLMQPKGGAQLTCGSSRLLQRPQLLLDNYFFVQMLICQPALQVRHLQLGAGHLWL